MNSAYRHKTSSAKSLIRFVGTHGSCVRVRHLPVFAGISIFVCIVAIISAGCSGQERKAAVDMNDMNKTHHIVAFCQGIDYADTAALHKDKVMAALMKDFVIEMKRSHPNAIAESLDILFKGLKGDDQSLRLASRYAYSYLGNPNSSVRDEACYLQYLEALLRIPELPEDLAERSKEMLRKTMLNRQGAVANDFHYIARNGKEGSLHQLKADRTMLIFYDPECPHCGPILKKIATDPQVNEGIESGAVKVLAVYTEGKRDVWEKTKNDMPQQWTVAYDITGILDKELYDIPAMPTVYILNADKRVLIKDMLW